MIYVIEFFEPIQISKEIKSDCLFVGSFSKYEDGFIEIFEKEKHGKSIGILNLMNIKSIVENEF